MTKGAGVLGKNDRVSHDQVDIFNTAKTVLPGPGQTYSTMRTVLGLVQRPHTQAAYMAGGVIARGNGMMGNGIGTDEAHIGVVILVIRRRRKLRLLLQHRSPRRGSSR